MQLNFHPLEIVFFSVAVVSLFVQLWYTFFIHGRLIKFKNVPSEEPSLKPISVVIAARNEAENLKKYLPEVLEQNYSNFEVIVVNDRSWDETADVLKEMAIKYSHLKIVTVSEGEKFIAGKKFAITMGIKAAQHEWLVFTDADCFPGSKNWLQQMAQPTDSDKSILLGYSPYYKVSGLLNALIRFETFYTAINYLGYAISKNPYMGVGRNMAYKKDLFFKGKGFAAHMHVPSGDDDLFVNAHANSTNTAIMIDPDSHVWTEPESTWRSYFKQKRRHSSAGSLYKAKHKWSLSIQVAFNLFFYAALIILFCTQNGLYPALVLLFLSLLGRVIVYPRLLKKLSYPELRWWYPFLDLLLQIFLLYNAIVSIFVKKASW